MSTTKSTPPAAAEARAAQPANLMDTVRRLLEAGNPDAAMEAIHRSGSKAPPVMNARGVCLLRLGKFEPAVAIFRDLVFPAGSFTMELQTPTVYQANYVLSLLLNGNPMVAMSVLGEIEDRDHPAVAKVRQAIKQWKKKLPLLSRALLLVGVCPDTPVTLDGPPGELL